MECKQIYFLHHQCFTNIPFYYQSYLTELNKQYGWHHLESPLIWIEYGISDDILEQMVEAGIEIPAPKAHYLGKASDFWEYCCEYYALHSVLSPSELKCLVQDNLKVIKDIGEIFWGICSKTVAINDVIRKSITRC